MNSQIVPVRFPAKTIAAIDKRAKQDKTTRSGVIHAAIEKLLGATPKGSEPVSSRPVSGELRGKRNGRGRSEAAPTRTGKKQSKRKARSTSRARTPAPPPKFTPAVSENKLHRQVNTMMDAVSESLKSKGFPLSGSTEDFDKPKLKAASKKAACPRCSGGLKEWGPLQMRCDSCKENFSKASLGIS